MIASAAQADHLKPRRNQNRPRQPHWSRCPEWAVGFAGIRNREIPNWKAGIESSALGRVLGAIFLDDQLREFRRGRSSSDVNWMTIERRVILRRP